jgi:hypothetical protein
MAEVGGLAMQKQAAVRHLEIFGDESSQQKRFSVYGTVSCETHETAMLEGRLEEALSPHGAEVKWNALNDIPAYERFGAALFTSFRNSTLRYRAIVVERHHEQTASISRELRLIKYIHTLLMGYARDHAKRDCCFYVHLDGGGTDLLLDSLRQYLNRHDQSLHGRTFDAFKLIKPADSKTSRLVQAADLLSGAIAYVTHGEHLKAGHSASRRQFAEFIANKAQLPASERLKKKGAAPFGALETLGEETHRAVALKGLSIWHVDPRAEAEKAIRRLSKDQLSLIPKGLRFGELKQWGFEIDVVCPRCDRYRRDFLRDNEVLRSFLTSSAPRLSCQRKSGCEGRGIVLLRPDPFSVPLIVDQLRKEAALPSDLSTSIGQLNSSKDL